MKPTDNLQKKICSRCEITPDKKYFCGKWREHPIGDEPCTYIDEFHCDLIFGQLKWK
jgi:hypothetical protein